MKPFLNHIIDDIDPAGLNELGEQAFVFPSKRACLHFKQMLRDTFSNKTFWSPSILSIEEFIEYCAGRKITDNLTLIFEMFKIYRKHDPKITLDRFYNWGQVLLQDFDEADKYLADADKLFLNLQEISDIEASFGETEEVKNALTEFTRVLGKKEHAMVIREFIRTWGTVRKVYREFRKELTKKGMAYSGMLYADLANGLEEGTRKLPFARVVFAGFNALSASEEKIFNYVIEGDYGIVYWDADVSFMEDPLDDAGKFLRRYKSKWRQSNSRWVVTDMKGNEPEIEVIGTAQGVGQSKVAGIKLKEMLKNKGVNGERSAIVLADENLLFPVLYSLPEEIEEVNVTMGYPLSKTSLNEIVELIIKLQINKRGKDKVYYRVGDVIKIMRNPVLRSAGSQSCFRLIRILQEKRSLWISKHRLLDENPVKFVTRIFDSFNDPSDLLENISDFLVAINNLIEEENDTISQEIIYHYIRRIRQLQQVLKDNKLNPDMQLLLKLLREDIKQTRIPFAGEPLSGFQVMGFLETRTLDFNNLIIVSVNENKLPSSRNRITYIPYSLRKNFHMPTFEEQDAIYAYHFKRALQRVNRAVILYDTEVAVDGSGEKSRLILQLQQLFQNKIQERVIAQRVSETMDQLEIIIDKDDDVLKLLKKYTVDGEDKAKLTPTALSTYIECKLRFYFKHLARIPEADMYEENVDAREFGIIVHRVMENIYREYTGKKVEPNDVKKLLGDDFIEDQVDLVYKEQNLIKEDQFLEGKNLLNKSIILRLIKKILENDLKTAPFTIESVETEALKKLFDIDGKKVLLGGKVDRIDFHEVSETIRIIDYKTGKVELLPRSKRNTKNYKQYFHDYFTQSKYKSGFQAYYYAYLYDQINPGKKIKAGVYSLKEVNKGIRFLREGEILHPSIFNEFEEQLKNLIGEIFDPKIPFTETDDRSKCEYCPYKSICKG